MGSSSVQYGTDSGFSSLGCLGCLAEGCNSLPVHGCRFTDQRRCTCIPQFKSKTPPFKKTPGCRRKKEPPNIIRGNPVRAPTPCLEQGCQDHATKEGRCNQHQRPRWVGSYRKQRLPRDWNTRRLIVLKRDQGVCYLCGQSGADTVDHVAAGDDHSLGNLKAVHDHVAPHCHRFKSSQEGHDAKAAQRVKPRH